MKALKNILLSGTFTLASTVSAFAKKPNIILIMADDMRFGNVSSFGATRMNTPHIDSLVKSGVKLTNFHTNSSICSPTRASFLTGLYQQRVGDGVDFGSVSSQALRPIINVRCFYTSFSSILQL